MATKYELSSDKDAVLRDGVKIANRDPDTGTLDYLPDCDRFRAPVSAFLKEIGEDKPPVTPPEIAARGAKFVGTPAAAPDNADTTPVTEERDPDALTPEQKRIKELEAQLAKLGMSSAAAKVAIGEKPSVEPKPLAKPVDIRHVVETQPGTGWVKPNKGDDFMDPIKLRTYPDAPKYDHRGDKTPAFVDWLFANHPEDAEHRYHNRHLPGKSYDERMAEVRARLGRN